VFDRDRLDEGAPGSRPPAVLLTDGLEGLVFTDGLDVVILLDKSLSLRPEIAWDISATMFPPIVWDVSPSMSANKGSK
jgi:hypothetical protein